MHRSFQCTIWMATAILVVVSTSLFAQQTGSVVGTVSDQSGAVVAHAAVTLTNAQTADVRTTPTNTDGFFAFSGVQSGDYLVTIEAKGFQRAKQSGIHVSPGDRRNLNVSMAIGTESTTVTVQAGSSAVVVDSGDLSSTLSAGNIRKLALQGRDVTELLKTLPGFNVNTAITECRTSRVTTRRSRASPRRSAGEFRAMELQSARAEQTWSLMALTLSTQAATATPIRR